MTSRQRSFRRKLMYLGGMLLIMLTMVFFTRPSRSNQGGGQLSRMREAEGLAAKSFGKVDATSQALKLSMFGLRSFALWMLWSRCDEHQQKKDWSSLTSTLDQIASMQPHYLGVWKYQAHNQSYNISVEFDNYKDRYYWVKQGIYYLNEGRLRNEYAVPLVDELAFYTAHKIGVADEKHEFRQMYRTDREFQGLYRQEFQLNTADVLKDNWLTGAHVQYRAQEMFDNGVYFGPLGKSATVFYSDAGMYRIRAAEALEMDGGPNGEPIFGDRASSAWRHGLDAWNDFGLKEITTALGDRIRLHDQKTHYDRYDVLLKEVEAMAPELIPVLAAKKRLTVEKRYRDLLDAFDAGKIPDDDVDLKGARNAIHPTPLEIAEAIEGPNRAQAIEMAKEAADRQRWGFRCRQQREIVNYDYWLTRCTWEMDPDTVSARQALAEGDQLFIGRADSEEAIKSYVRSLDAWKVVTENHPEILEDETAVDALIESIDRLRRVASDLAIPPIEHPMVETITLAKRKLSPLPTGSEPPANVTRPELSTPPAAPAQGPAPEGDAPAPQPDNPAPEGESPASP